MFQPPCLEVIKGDGRFPAVDLSIFADGLVFIGNGKGLGLGGTRVSGSNNDWDGVRLDGGVTMKLGWTWKMGKPISKYPIMYIYLLVEYKLKVPFLFSVITWGRRI